jgi:tRNA A-37 threonylcarbamoyl transferase component Bud32
MTDASYPDALPAQHRLHWYVLERVLGQGGFGITYLARDANLDQQVAIKEYLPVDVATRRADASVRARTEEQSERYRWGLDRFIREARTLARFDHPNIVRVLSVFEHNNTAYMVMRFEEGENLAALLERRRTLAEDELMRIVLPILDGLELVHNAGFIHRDIKPDNIHIRDDGSPVLLDFGSARHSMGHARTVTILVAPGYAPFEQYYSSGENQGPWTDLYSLGATCYRAIAGIAPMDAITRSKGILGSTREILVPAATIGTGRYSPGLLKAVDHALQFAEKDRPQTIAEWRRELMEGARAVARAAPATVSVTPATAPARAAPVQAQVAASAPSMRGPVIWATLGALVAATAVVGLLLWWQSPRQAPSETEIREKILADLKRDEQARLEQAARAQKEKDAAAQRQLEDQQKQEAARLAAAEQERKRADEARREAEAKKAAEAQKKAEAERARRDADARKKAEAQRQAEEEALAARRKAEEARRAEEARKAEESGRAAAAAAASKPAVPAPQATAAAAPGAELLAQAEQAAKRGNDAESLSLYRRAANEGSTEAQFRLGEMFATGKGVNQSNFQAYVWFSLAASAGHAGARARRDQVIINLQPAEIQQADRLIQDRLQALARRKG